MDGPYQSLFPDWGRNKPLSDADRRAESAQHYFPSSSEISRGILFHSSMKKGFKTPFQPSRQLPTSTLSPSDFGHDPVPFLDFPNSTIGDKDYHTPAPVPLPIPSSWTVGIEASMKALEGHMRYQGPFVMEASKKLQQIVELRCDEVFETPAPPDISGLINFVDVNPALRHLKGDLGRLRTRNPLVGGPTHTGSSMIRNSWEQTAGAPERPRYDAHGKSNKPAQAPQQKLGLRESLLWHGRQPYGRQSRVELCSISFHDLTPDMRTGEFSNELLGHYTADPAGRTRLVCYEVDVLSTTGQKPKTERWISFLLSTPLISIGPANYPATHPEPLPPNLPHPPTSWLMFAAPLSNVTVHPPQKDQVPITLDPTAPSATGNPRRPEATMREVRRLDYDFSRKGVPIFEFMDKEAVLGQIGHYLQDQIGGDFLCAQNLRAWDGKNVAEATQPRPQSSKIPTGPSLSLDGTLRDHGTDDSEAAAAAAPQPMAPHHHHHQVTTDKEAPRLGPAATDDDDDDDAAEDLAVVIDMDTDPWWRQAKAHLWNDANQWERIREAMARACCRVIVRRDPDWRPPPPQQRLPELLPLLRAGPGVGPGVAPARMSLMRRGMLMPGPKVPAAAVDVKVDVKAGFKADVKKAAAAAAAKAAASVAVVGGAGKKIDDGVGVGGLGLGLGG